MPILQAFFYEEGQKKDDDYEYHRPYLFIFFE